MTKFVNTLWIQDEPSEIHTFDLTYGDPRWYVTITSLDSFSTRESTRLYHLNIKKQSGKKLPCLPKRSHLRRENEMMPWEFELYQHLPKFHHDTLWDMYIAIGYDFKKRKYVD